MKRALISIGAAVLVAALLAPGASAQPPAQEPDGQLVPLRLQLVISRQLGEKKISSMPYTLWVTANEDAPTRLRMGVDVPVPTTVTSKETPVSSYQYRPVGTNIDCSARSAGGGRYKVNITLSDTSIHFDPKDSAQPGGMPGVAAFRNFTSNFNILLRDGQTAQYTSAIDPVTGETLRVDATLEVLK